MNETKILIFRSSNCEFGIPLEAVRGVVTNSISGAIGEQLSAEQQIILRPTERFSPLTSKQTIIVQSDGVQLALLADQVLRTDILGETAKTAFCQSVTFQLWKLSTKENE